MTLKLFRQNILFQIPSSFTISSPLLREKKKKKYFVSLIQLNSTTWHHISLSIVSDRSLLHGTMSGALNVKNALLGKSPEKFIFYGRNYFPILQKGISSSLSLPSSTSLYKFLLLTSHLYSFPACIEVLHP